MKIALVNLVPTEDPANYFGFNHGLGYLSAVLKQAGRQTHLFIVSAHRESTSIKQLNDYQPDAIFVYLATNQYPLFARLLEHRQLPARTPLFVGGPHATVCPDEVAGMPGVTGACVGDGELTALKIVERIAANESFDDIPNLYFVRDDELIRNPVGHCELDLDSLPFPDREIFPYPEMLRNRAINLMGFEFMGTRGCIYGCRYCINPHLNTLKEKQHWIRRRSVQNVIDEILAVSERYDHTGMLGFHDDIFTLDRQWLAEFAAVYRERVDRPFWCNAHIGNLDEEIILNLRRAGCFRVHVGIECGNEEMRRKILNKSLSNENILRKVALLKKNHFKIVTTFMVGLPGENEDHLKQSIDLCRSIQPDWVLLSTFCPYPGTGLYTELVEQGRIEPDFYKRMDPESFYSAKTTFSQEQLPQKILNHYFENFVTKSRVG